MENLYLNIYKSIYTVRFDTCLIQFGSRTLFHLESEEGTMSNYSIILNR